uniref:Uncharacterized protein n=1 Tax=Attheya septentrionalis TaxID=420275 RepID=A0A7S2UQ74_9STRA|mmetsp:Transcript_5053/g.8875  ORF Transcript_5053/g.8875 Transcript_5053/m.8875 type:complete len:146 (+) Transcript_5053:3-440(+)
MIYTFFGRKCIQVYVLRCVADIVNIHGQKIPLRPSQHDPQRSKMLKTDERSMNIHLRGMLPVFRHSQKQLLKSNSRCFVGMSSVDGGMGHPGAAWYAIAKVSVDCAIRQLALEYASKGIRVLRIAPGIIDTPTINNVGSLIRKRF